MNLTRRGTAVAGVVALAFVLAWTFGARSLNAVVAPALIALLAAAVQVRRVGQVSASRSRPAPGFPGETRTVELTVETADLLGHVEDEVGPGLTATGNRVETSEETVEYEIHLDRRGEHDLGPLRVTVQDVLGLVEREFRYPATTPVLVYPAVYDLRGTSRAALARLVDEVAAAERNEFDRLREYASGDTLRDIHWRSSAKRSTEDFVVMEFAARGGQGGIAIAAEAAPGHADEMAAAAASVASFVLDAGLAVEVTAPGGGVSRGGGETQRGRVLELLARTPAGRVADVRRETADVTVTADGSGVHVTVGGRRVSFDRLARGRTLAAAPARDVAADGSGDGGGAR